MLITEAIFREIQVVEEWMFEDYDSEMGFSDEYIDILMQLAQKELEVSRDDYDSEEDFEEAVQEEAYNIIRVCRFDAESLLAIALRHYYGSYTTMINSIRSAVDNYHVDGYIYYVTGIGYDTVSADLLNGSADGKAKYEFLAKINEIEPDENMINYYKYMAKL